MTDSCELEGVIPIPLVTRATFNATGAITFTGNTLGLSRSEVAGVPGTLDSIGAFTTTNTASVYGTYPAGTTNAYASNSSSAILTLPAGSTILYAELIWGGSYINATVDLSAFINNPVTFTTPAGTFSISPDSATSNQVNLGNGAFAYVRSANVTSLITQGGAGTYRTGNVVGTIVLGGETTANHCGWTLGVIYQNTSLPFRNMSLRAGAVLVQADSGPVSTTLTGFATPISGTLGGRALFSAQEGDANRTGDQALFGPTTGTAAALSGTNNFANNFFASQINNDAGALNTTGTFGNRNQTNGAPGSNISAGRQGWDITNVDVSARLINNQSSAVLILTTSGDAYVVNANAIQININSPIINVVKSASVAGAVVGDTITYTVTVSNTGTANAASVVLTDALPAGLTFVGGSVTVGGIPRPTYDILSGAPLGALNLNSSVVITYRAIVSSLPSTFLLPNSAKAAFTFQMVAGGQNITGVIPSNTVSTPVYSPIIGIAKSSNRTTATVGSTVTYTLLVSNTGNRAANVSLTDNIPTGSSFITGTFRVNGSVVAGANPAAGVAIGSVAAGAASTVTFDVQVNTLPSPPQFVDQGTATYTYSPPDGRTISGSAASNTLTLPVSLPNVTAAKSVNVTDVAVGETLTYTSVITNNGAEAVTNVSLTDVLPAGTAFVPGSVTIDGTPHATANPATGIAVGTVAANSSATVTLQAAVSSMPASAQLINRSNVSYTIGIFSGTAASNSTTTPVYQPVIPLTKLASSTAATVGDTITYTILARNTGNLAATVTLLDNIPAGSSFVPGSVTINGVASPASSPLSGIVIGSLAPNGQSTVTFQTLLNTLPSPPVLVDQAASTYSYTLPSGRTLNGSSSSNSISITASSPNVTITKTVSDTAAALQDVLTYMLLVTNNGIAPVTNVVLSDPVPPGSSFVTGTVFINSVASPLANPNAGISLGTINAGVTVTVAFQIRVVSLPASGTLSNAASVGFTSGAFTSTSISNTVTTPASEAVVSISKSASTDNATVGDTFSYSFTLTNSGNTEATATLTDTVPEGSVFVENSVLINGAPTPDASPVTGIPVGVIPAGGSAVVSYVVNIVAYPASRQLVNQAAASYTFTLSNGRIINRSALSNTVTVQVALPNVSLVKSVSRTVAVTGDTMTFTSVLTNNGIAAVNNIVLRDQLQTNAAFVPGSVLVQNVSRPAASPEAGISLGSLAPGASVTVTFEVSITMAIPSEITNQSTASFTSGTFSATTASNTTVTPVTQPQIAIAKSASTGNATLGDSIIYTLSVANTGNLAAAVIVTDTIPAGTTFTENSIIVNGVPFPGISPVTGIDIGSVAPGGTTTVTFGVVVTALPSPQVISNTATAAYSYTPPDGRTLNGSVNSNTVSFPVSAPNVGVDLSANYTAVTIGDTIVYTAVISNSGIETINNVQFTDPAPAGTSFIPGTVTVNGTPVPGASPIGGIPVGSIPPGGTVTIIFSNSVNAVPDPAVLNNTASVTFTSGAFSGTAFSNTVSTPVYRPVVSVVKSSSTSNASVGETVTYSFLVSNTGNYPSTITLTDNIPAGTSFVPNSVIVGGAPVPGVDPVTGIPIGSVAAGATVGVMFSVVIDTLPNPQQLTDTGTASISYTLPDGRPFNETVVSNTVTFPVSAPNAAVVKSTTSTAVSIGDTVTYATTITNSGIATISNVLFTDPIPAGSSFVAGSLTVDGVLRPAANPATGIIIDAISPGATTAIVFNVIVTSLPAPAVLNNQSSVTFTSGAFSGVTFSNTVSTPVYQPILSAAKTGSTTNATVGDTVTYTVAISNTGNYGADVTITDTIPAGTVFVPNSVIVNNQPVPGVDPSTGIPLGNVTTSATVSFSVIVQSLTTGQQLTNQASATYAYTLPDGRTLNGSLTSNTLVIQVSAPNVAVVKAAAVPTAVVGDTVTYTIGVTNNGIAPINNVVVGDAIPAGAVFVADSVTVDGLPRPGASPAAGISVGTIAPGITSTITFNLTITSLPSPAPAQLSNQASATFTSGAFSGSTFSNTVNLPVYQAIIAIQKAANTTNATVGDTVTYDLHITNTGNVPAQVTLTDPVPSGGAFIPNSVQVNGVPQPGANPSAGFSVGTVNPGDLIVVSVSYEVIIQTLPPSQQLVNTATGTYSYLVPDGRTIAGSVNSNTLSIPVSSPDVSVVKSTSAIDAVVGDVITYNIVVTNLGISPVSNVILVDPVPTGTVFVPGSVTVNSIQVPAGNPNTGISIGTIAAGASATVTFNVQVVAI
ncbi:conserved repeat domain-containing protein [Paenibacillus catalpae]|uniref:Conserved repeat domain-containing protein n=1 Tax=Paenibacillus catalpae TaxID=1045775 RepID=A0A1I1VGB7_9BACL|nr:conserved repeat domain-containing protein [Paenibacillus catalpae]